MNIINGQDVFGAQTLTTNFPMKVIDIDFFSPPQSITLGQEEDHYSTLLHLNINEQSLNGEDDDSLIIYIVIKQDNGNILQYPIYAPEGVLNVTNYGIKISQTEYYFPVVSTMTDHPHNGTIQFRIHAAAMNVDDLEDREGALIAASSKIKYRVDDSIAFNANVPSKFYDRFLEPSSGIVTPEMFQRADNAPQYTDDMLINMALKSNAKVVLMIGDYVLDSPIIIAGPTYQPKTIFHKGSITYTGKKILEKYGKNPDNSNWTISPYSVRLQDGYERTADSIDSIIFNNGIEFDIETGLKYTNTNIKVHVYPKTKSAILITDIGSVCNITFDKIESSGDGIEFLSNTVRKNVGVSGTGSYDRTAVQYVNLYFGSISARYGEKIDNNVQTTGSSGNIQGGKCIYFNLATIDESQKVSDNNGSHYYCTDDIPDYSDEDEEHRAKDDTKTIKGWINEIRIYDGRLNSGAYGIYADGRTTENKINNIKIQNVALEPNNLKTINDNLITAYVNYNSYLDDDQKTWIRTRIFGNPHSLLDLSQEQRTVSNIMNYSQKINIEDFVCTDKISIENNGNKYYYLYNQTITFKKLYRGIYIANGCDRWTFAGLRYAEKPTIPSLIYNGFDEPNSGDVRVYVRTSTYNHTTGNVVNSGTTTYQENAFCSNSLNRSTQGWLLETVGTVREFLFEGAQYSSDSNFKFSDRTSGTLIMPNADGETIQTEEGTAKISRIFASFRTVTDGVISPFQEAEIPYVEEIVHNMNALAVDTIMDIEGNSWETLTKNISTYRDFRYKDQNNNVVADPDLDPLNQNSNLKRNLRPRLVRGDSFGTYKNYYSFFGSTEIYNGLYKIELELKGYENESSLGVWSQQENYSLRSCVFYDGDYWVLTLEGEGHNRPGQKCEDPITGEIYYPWKKAKFKNSYYFYKTDNELKLLPSKTYVTNPSDTEEKIQQIEFGELESEDIFNYSPVIYNIKYDHIPGECDSVKTSNSDNYCMTIYGLVDKNYKKDDVLDPFNDTSEHIYPLRDGVNGPVQLTLSITVRKLSYQSFEHDISSINENIYKNISYQKYVSNFKNIGENEQVGSRLFPGSQYAIKGYSVVLDSRKQLTEGIYEIKLLTIDEEDNNRQYSNKYYLINQENTLTLIPTREVGNSDIFPILKLINYDHDTWEFGTGSLTPEENILITTKERSRSESIKVTVQKYSSRQAIMYLLNRIVSLESRVYALEHPNS